MGDGETVSMEWLEGAMQAQHERPSVAIADRPLIEISEDDGLTHEERQIASARAKLGWARRGIQYLQSSVADYLDYQPVTVRAHLHPREGDAVLLHVWLASEPLPAELGLISGNILGDLRTALDHAHVGLCPQILSTKKRTPKIPKFPTPYALAKKDWGTRFNGIGSGFPYPLSVRAFLKCVYAGMTYENRADHLLCQLGKLVAEDKHQAIVAIATRTTAEADVTAYVEGRSATYGIALPDPGRNGETETLFDIADHLAASTGAMTLDQVLTNLSNLDRVAGQLPPHMLQATTRNYLAIRDSFTKPKVIVNAATTERIVAAGRPEKELVALLTEMAEAVQEVIRKYEIRLGIGLS